MHLHLRAQMAFLASDAAAKSQQLQRLREVAGEYVPLLKDSYNGLLIWTEGDVPQCHWEYPANWSSICDGFSPETGNFCQGPFEGYFPAATFQADPDVSCLTGCKSFMESEHPYNNPGNFCTVEQLGPGAPTLGPWSLCSEEDARMPSSTLIPFLGGFRFPYEPL